jgi:hypothetical protein
MLYQVTDLGAVWVIADVFEQDIAAMRPGARAAVRINAYPERSFPGTVTYVYPTLKAETRTVPVRIELANPGQLLKPAMFAQVELPAGDPRPVLTVPDSAVIDSGTRTVVLVQLGEGRFEPREVKLGAPQRRLRAGAGRPARGRAGGRGSQLPDRRREQHEGGGAFARRPCRPRRAGARRRLRQRASGGGDTRARAASTASMRRPATVSLKARPPSPA